MRLWKNRKRSRLPSHLAKMASAQRTNDADTLAQPNQRRNGPSVLESRRPIATIPLGKLLPSQNHQSQRKATVSRAGIGSLTTAITAGTQAPAAHNAAESESQARRRARQEAKQTQPPTIPKHLYVPPQFVVKVASFAEEPLVTEAEIAELRALQVQFDRANDFLNDHFRDNAKKKFREQQLATATEVLAGGGKEAAERDSWSLIELQQEHEVKKRALKGDIRRISAAAIPIAVRVAGRLGAVAANLIEHFEETELVYNEGWGLEFAPSRVLTMLRYVAQNPQDLIQAYATTSPRAVLAFVGVILPATK